ncbi:MAG: LysR family transcriptional regulator, partial [Asticcacaulis sp.]
MEHHPLDLDDLRAFFLVAETGSFARAAQRLQSSKSIVSRRVARLEQTLQALLLQRTARGTHLTEAGQRYYEQARAALT